MADFEKAIVTAVHPQDHSVDVTLLRSGARLAGVQVLSQSASTNTGFADLSIPKRGTDDAKWDMTQTSGRQLYAVIGYMGREPFVQGFLFPQIGQMTFADQNRRIDRHASDVYSTIDSEGNTEFYHPSGTYLRFGTTPGHEDLTGKDFDGNWAISNNTATAPYVCLVVANAGTPALTFQIDPSGNLEVTSASGKASFSFPGGMSFTTPTAAFSENVTAGTDITAGGNVTDSVRSMAADREIYNSHTHSNNGASPPSAQE
jgi:hypothetical protein